jgi:flagellar basal-body rod protein FlgF
MLNGLYSAAAGMDVAQERHETAAMNLASAQQPGFRRTQSSHAMFQSALLATRVTPREDAANAQPMSGDLLDFRTGAVETTGRNLDLALQGEGFFVVEGPQGPLYTRNGRFFANESGELVTVDGLRVQGQNGAIQIPTGASTESVQVTTDGRLLADGREFGQLEIVQFTTPQQLQRAGKSLFTAPDVLSQETATATVSQGVLEGSNVSAVSELIELIAASRQYEASSQAMQSMTQATAKHTNLGGRN